MLCIYQLLQLRPSVEPYCNSPTSFLTTQTNQTIKTSMDPFTITLCTIAGAAGIKYGRDMIHRHLKKTKERLTSNLDEYLFPEANKCLSPSSVLAPTFQQVWNHAAPKEDDLRRTQELQNCYVYHTMIKDSDRVLIYFPSGDEILTAHVAPSDGQSSPKDGKRVILKSPCVERLDKLSARIHMPVFGICYPGYCPTDQCEVTYEHVRKHALRAVSYVAHKHNKAIHEMIFMGRGVGAALALEIASNPNNAPEKVVLLSPFTTATDACKTPVGSAVPKVGGPDNLKWMRKVKIPMLLSGDGSDDVHLPGHIDKLCDARKQLCPISEPFEHNEQNTPSSPSGKRKSQRLPPIPRCYAERHTCPGTESYFSDDPATEPHVADLYTFINRSVAVAQASDPATEPETSK